MNNNHYVGELLTNNGELLAATFGVTSEECREFLQIIKENYCGKLDCCKMSIKLVN